MEKKYSSLTYSWRTSNLNELGQQLLAENSSLPESAEVDGKELKIKNFSPALIESSKHSFIANWAQPSVKQLSIEKPDTVRINQTFELPVIENVLAWLEKLNFDVCIGGKLFSDWPLGVKVVLFPGQYPLGWMLAFKGNGHRHLISQRWLENSPVKIHRKGDVTLIQFHDLDENSDVAFAQAQAGWKAFNFAPESGLVNKAVKAGAYKFDGQYNPEDGGLYVTVQGRDISYDELNQATYAKNFSELTDGRSIEKIVYVFLEVDRAKKWLHDLWLRDIECRTFVDGHEIILSNEYIPPKNNVGWD